MRVTIKDIAEKTGLSVSTVSLVLNKKQHRIPEATRRRVLDAARELHYRPNRMAASLVTKKTGSVGLIIPDITNMFFAEIAKGAETECRRLGYSLILCNTNDSPKADVDYVNVLIDHGIDGVLFTMAVNSTDHRAEECFSILRRFEKPVVLVDRTVQGGETVNVLSDNEAGGYLATKHLLELGHRKIACLTGPMGAQSSKQRFFGYIRALQEFGVAFDPVLVKEGTYHTQSGFLLAEDLLKTEATAIFACNDMMAYGVYQRAASMGIRVPQRISVVGFDDLAFSEFMEVPLSTVHQPSFELGREAAAKIISWIDHPDRRPQSVTFRPELVVRKSTAPPGARIRGDGNA